MDPTSKTHPGQGELLSLEGPKMETDEIGRKLMIRHAMSCHVLPAIAMWCYYLLYMSPRRIEYVSG